MSNLSLRASQPSLPWGISSSGLPPSPPPPPSTLVMPRRLAFRKGPLTGERCSRMMRNPSHLFRRMWSAEPWGLLTASSGVPCWNRRRDAPDDSIAPSAFFSEALNGTHCDSNWYEGHEGQLGHHWTRPQFTSAAPAVLGFDDGIVNLCEARARARLGPGQPLPRRGGSEGHIKLCMAANLNILNLVAGKIPYNLCRNLEWQVCAATGRLPGQHGSGVMLFANAPSVLDPSGLTGRHRPLGKCGGYKPKKAPSGGVFGFGNWDIYYLEVCLFHHLCANGEDLFSLHPGQPFVCKFSSSRFASLEAMLRSPIGPAPKDAVQCTAE